MGTQDGHVIIPGNECRVDIVDEHGSFEVSSHTKECTVSRPGWLNRVASSGVVISSAYGHFTVTLSSQTDKSLKVILRGPDERFLDGERKPVWVKYTSLMIDGIELLHGDVMACHDRPWVRCIDVKDGLVEISVDWLIRKNILDDETASSAGGSAHDQQLMLEQRVLSLEHELKLIREVLHCDSIELVKEKWKNDIWGLKEYMLTIPEANRSELRRAYEAILKENGSWIGPNSMWKTRPITPHGLLGIFVSDEAKLGSNVVVFQHVTIGSNTIEGSVRYGSPTIGDDCYIGSGAKIIGCVKVGNNVRIGANCVVCTDVPDNSVVVLNKPRIIRREGMDNKFYHRVGGVYGYHKDGKFVAIPGR